MYELRESFDDWVDIELRRQRPFCQLVDQLACISERSPALQELACQGHADDVIGVEELFGDLDLRRS